jgi:uncharacterized membrane protein YqgA involved in biofilm formation
MAAMFAVIVNVVAVILGSLLGLFFGRRSERVRALVMTSAGLVTLLIGLQMAWKGQRVLYLLVAILAGGLIGYALDIEGKILRFGELLKRLVPRSNDAGFAQGFLAASVLFCVGAMAILGSFQAGAEGKYDIILIKSIMDGCMAVVLTGALGIGVGFSALSILIYQGALTLAASAVKPWVDAHPLVLSEVSGVGGLMVVMISLNLLELKKIPTGNFLPALVIIVLLAAADPWISNIASLIR